jgi:hypothetical protein
MSYATDNIDYLTRLDRYTISIRLDLPGNYLPIFNYLIPLVD